MADVFKRLRGVVGNLFQVGAKEDGPNLKNNSDVLEIRDDGDTVFATARAAHIASGAALNDIVSLLDLQGRVPNILFSFDGASPPTPSTVTGQFGICHTSGGAYTEGVVYYSDGTSLIEIPDEVVRTITTSAAVAGNLNLNANGLYALQSGAWVLKGDGAPSDTGYTRVIEVPIGTNPLYNSTTAVADGDRIFRTVLITEVIYDNNAEATVFIDGTSDETLLTTIDSKLEKLGQYESDEIHLITSSNEGLVEVTISNTPTTGSGRVVVFYGTPSA